ncbi:hypothetical protein ACHQM5_027493 [Ranunculus cassubicifolius]
MGKVPLLLLLLTLFFTSDEIKAEGKICEIASVGCKSGALCNQLCLIKYNGRGSCYRPPGTYFIECMCWYKC